MWDVITVQWWPTSQQWYHLSTSVLHLSVGLVLERRTCLRVFYGCDTTAAEGVVPRWEWPQLEEYVCEIYICLILRHFVGRYK